MTNIVLKLVLVKDKESVYDFVMDLIKDLADKFKTTPDIIDRIRSTYFMYKTREETEKILTNKLAKDTGHKSPHYTSRENTVNFLKSISPSDFLEIIVDPEPPLDFGGIRTCLLEILKDGWIEKTGEPPTVEDFLELHKKWRKERISQGKNETHELARIKQYEASPEVVRERLKEEFNKITS